MELKELKELIGFTSIGYAAMGMPIGTNLHIDVQEKLIETLREINPDIQYIVTTHCPSIVSGWKDRVISLDKK